MKVVHSYLGAVVAHAQRGQRVLVPAVDLHQEEVQVPPDEPLEVGRVVRIDARHHDAPLPAVEDGNHVQGVLVLAVREREAIPHQHAAVFVRQQPLLERLPPVLGQEELHGLHQAVDPFPLVEGLGPGPDGLELFLFMTWR
jgi:hypothetical protein